MPEVHIFLAAGRTPAQKKALMKGLTDAVVAAIGSDIGAVTVQIIEAPLTDKMKNGQTSAERNAKSPRPG